MSLGLISLIVFLALMTGIGIWGLRRTRTLNDFFLGGRKMGPWVSAIAYGTSYFSAVIFIGFAGKQGWAFGLNALWIALGNAVFGGLLAWLVLARRTRSMSMNLHAMTMPEFLQERYQARFLKPLAASIIFIFLLPYSASVFKGLGHLFEASFHISYDLALLIMIGFTGVYLVLGGYFALAVSDFIQGIIMIFGAFALIAVFSSEGGGITKLLGSISEGYAAHISPEKRPDLLSLISLIFMTSFGPWGLPQMVQKYYALKDTRIIKTGALVTTIFAAVIGFSAYFVGASAHAFFTPATVPQNENGILFDSIVPELLSGKLPEALMVLIMLLVLSASMSTLSSLVLVSSSSIAIDLIGARKAEQAGSIRTMRLLSAFFVLVSYLISRFQFDIIVNLMSLSWGAVAGAFAAPYVYGLYWKRGSKAGAYAGLISGLGTEILLFYLLGPAKAPLAASAAMLVPFIVFPLVSLKTKAPNPEHLTKAFTFED